MLTSEQIRMGRAALRWSMNTLAQRSGVGESTIKRIETFDGVPKARAESLAAIEKAMMEAGIRFLGENGVVIERE